MPQSVTSLFTESVTSIFNEALHKPFHPGYLGDNLWMMTEALRQQFPGGIDYLVVGAAGTPGFQIVRGAGIIAVLIGLTLPAVLKLVGDPHRPADAGASRSGGTPLERLNLRPGGRAGIYPDYLTSLSWSWNKVRSF